MMKGVMGQQNSYKWGAFDHASQVLNCNVYTCSGIACLAFPHLVNLPLPPMENTKSVVRDHTCAY